MPDYQKPVWQNPGQPEAYFAVLPCVLCDWMFFHSQSNLLNKCQGFKGYPGGVVKTALPFGIANALSGNVVTRMGLSVRIRFFGT